MDTDPDPRADLTAAQRIAIALGTAEPPPAVGGGVDVGLSGGDDGAGDAPSAPPA